MFSIKFIKLFLFKENFNLIFFDQIVVSAGNFLISIIILRFLGLEDFGVFSFYWLFLFLIYGLQISYIHDKTITPCISNDFRPTQLHKPRPEFFLKAFDKKILLAF